MTKYYYRTRYFKRMYNEAGYILTVEPQMIMLRNIRQNTVACYIVEDLIGDEHYLARDVNTGDIYHITMNEYRAIFFNKREAIVYK